MPGKPPDFARRRWPGTARTREPSTQFSLSPSNQAAKLLKPGHKIFWGGYVGFFEDPDGHLWEVAHNPHSPLSPDGQLTLPD